MLFSKKVETRKNLILLLFILISLPALSWEKLWSQDKLIFDAVLGIETIGNSPGRLLIWGKSGSG